MRTQQYVDRIQRLGRVVYDMERHGVPISLEVCSEMKAHAQRDEDETLRVLDDLAGSLCGVTETNWNYAGWLVKLLHDGRPHGLGLSPSVFCSKGRTKDGKVATDGTALDWLASQNPEHRDLLNLIRKLRQQHRMANYAESWMELAVLHPDGSYRLHPSFGMAFDADTRPGAKTGRFGLKNPALQQVPNDPKKDPYRLRRAFIAAPGKVLLVADYSQLEIVVVAHLCVMLFGATGLRDRLLPGQPDMHSATAKYVFGDVLRTPEVLANTDLKLFKTEAILHRFRDQVKRIRYGLAYGKGAYGFGNSLFEYNDAGDIIGPPMGMERAQVLVDALLDMDPELRHFQKWVWEYGFEHEGMPSLLGRWDLSEVIRSSDKWAANRKYRQWLNWPMQVGAQEIVAETMIACNDAGYDMSLQVHDELHYMVDPDKVDEAQKTLKEIGETTVELRAPLRFEPGSGVCWEDAKG